MKVKVTQLWGEFDDEPTEYVGKTDYDYLQARLRYTVEALDKAMYLVAGEYCSHLGPCGRERKSCYISEFMGVREEALSALDNK